MPEPSANGALERVLDRVQSAKRTGAGSYEARCPAHEDRKASLSISRGDQRVLLHCHAGCSYEAVLKALDLSKRDLFDKPPVADVEQRQIVATYDYTDSDGKPLYQTVRYQPKDFRQRHYCPNGKLTWGLGGKKERCACPRVTLVPYRLHEWHDSTRPVFIVEGEKDADRLTQEHVLATTFAMGTGEWQAGYAKHFTGRSVTIICDLDPNHAGQAHAAEIATALEGVAERISCWEPAKGKDVSDHLAAGIPLQDCIETTVDAWEQTVLNGAQQTIQEAAPDTTEAPPARSPLVTITARELCAIQLDPADELLGPLIVKGQRIVLGAHTGHGKTTLSLQLLAALTQGGGEFLGWQAPRPIRALFIDAEQGLRSLQKRLREAGVENDDSIELLRAPDGMSLDKDEWERLEIERIIEDGGFEVVAADPLYKLHTGESNEERAAVDLMRVFDRWREALGFAFILPVHCRKPPSQGSTRFSMHEFFGSSAYLRGAEVVLGLQMMRAGYSRLHFFKDRDGDLPIGAAWGLLYDRQTGFRKDPTGGEKRTAATAVRDSLEQHPESTISQIMTQTGYAEKTVRNALKQLGATGTAPSVTDEMRYFLPAELGTNEPPNDQEDDPL